MFNQPLSSFNTSKVTDMRQMFAVRPFDSRQSASSLSADNKLAIRCAWADTAAFDAAGYDSNWAPGSC